MCEYKDSDGSQCIRKLDKHVGIHVVRRGDGKTYVAEGTIEYLQETAKPYFTEPLK